MKPIEHGSSSPTLCLPSAPYHDIIAPGQYACMASNWCQKEKKFHCVYILFFICYFFFIFNFRVKLEKFRKTISKNEWSSKLQKFQISDIPLCEFS